MLSSSRSRLLFGAAIALAGLFTTLQAAQADGVESQQAKVDRIANQLEDIQNQIGQLDEDYGGAMDRKDALDQEIATAEMKVSAQQGELTALQDQLAQIAINKYTSGGGFELSPLFSSASTYVEDQQRTQLNSVAYDIGDADADQLQGLISDLQDQRTDLEAKHKELDQLIATLDSKMAEGQKLETQYKEIYAQAQADLGDAIAQEQARRDAEIVQQAVAKANANAAKNNVVTPTTQPARGGGNTGGGTTPTTNPPNTGGGSGGGGATGTTSPPTTQPPQQPTAPPPSSRAGIAVAAAYSMLGVPYVAFKADPSVGFDCSGLTMWVWAKAGVSLPHQSGMQFASLPHVTQAQIQPGDLLFYKSPIGHVAIYIGNGQLIHAPATGKLVSISTVNWSKVVGIARPG